MTVLDRALEHLDALNARELTLRELARMLDTNESYLSRILAGHLKRVESTTELRKKTSELAQSRRFMREKHANLVKSGQESLRKAAFHAKCSQRTIRRYIQKLESK
jgi:AraC-like DNA-binding protein